MRMPAVLGNRATTNSRWRVGENEKKKNIANLSIASTRVSTPVSDQHAFTANKA